MLDWVFDGLIGWTESNIVNKLLDAFSSLLLDSLGVDMTVMMSYFPFLETTFQVIRYIAWSLLFLIIVWQLFRSFGGPIVEAEHPMTLLARGSLAAFLIGYSREVFDILIRIATEPYNALLSAPTAAVSFTNIYEFLKTELQKAAYGIALSSTGFSLLIIILVIAIAWNYFKLALEVVERYVMMGVLYFTAPLGFAMFGSKSTANVFKAWCRMVGSEFFLLIMNVWFIRGFNSAVSAMLLTGGNIAGKTGTGILLCLFCILAFLKIAQRFDSYLSTLGLNTAQTGGQLGMEMLMATRLVAGVAGTKGGMSVGSVFRPGAQSPAGNAATGTGAASNGFAAKIKGAFSAETYKRNAISVGKQQGVGGINGFALNTLAAQKLKYGSEVNASTISQITSGQLVPKNNVFSGKSADNSIGNYLPALKDKKLNGTVVEAGHIQSEIISQNGQQTHFEAFSASAFEKPEGVFTTIAASDGSHWYVSADNIPSEGLGEKISFTGNVDEKDAVADMFPQGDITSLRTVESGVMEATYSDGTTGMLISASEFDVPEGMSGTVTDSAGNEWYEMGKSADTTMLNGIDNEPYTSMHGENNEPPVNDVMERNNTPPAGEAYTFTGSAAESEKLHELFPDIPQGATGLSIDTGVMEITSPTGEVSDIYRTDMFENSDAKIGEMKSSDGYSWQVVPANTEMPALKNDISDKSVDHISTDMPSGSMTPEIHSSDINTDEPSGSMAPEIHSSDIRTDVPSGSMEPEIHSGAADNGNNVYPSVRAHFNAFMPEYEQNAVRVDTSMRQNGIITVTNDDGSGTRFYDSAKYMPSNSSRTVQDVNNHKWYAVNGRYEVVKHVSVDSKGEPIVNASGKVQMHSETTMAFLNEPKMMASPKKKTANTKRPRKK